MPSEKQHLERKENIKLILDYLRKCGCANRKQLAKDLKLSWGCVSELTAILLKNNVICEQKAELTEKKGRTPSVLKLRDDICFLGIDINKSGLRATVCNLNGVNISQYREALDYSSKEAFVDSVCLFAGKIIRDVDAICGIGFAMQGVYDKQSDTWTFPGKTDIIIDFKSDFSGKFEVPFCVAHDPECILKSCYDENKKSSLLVRIDSGIGAVMIRKNPFITESLMEIGYFVVGEKGERLHDIASVCAIEKKSGKPLSKSFSDEKAKMLLKDAGKYLGIVLGNICNLLPVDEIILCGELILYYDLFKDVLNKHYKETVIPLQISEIRTVTILDAACGAAKMAMQKFEV